MKKWVLLLAASFALPCQGKDIAVLVDVSGTMSRYGPWQNDAISLVNDVLSGRASPSDTAWTVIGKSDAASAFSLGPGDKLHFILFGNVDSPNFPYFRSFDFDTASDLASAFPRAASAYHEARTNKPLAIAVGARMAARNGGAAQLIMISDFLNDSDLNSSQQDFFNRFDSDAEQSSPVTFSWKKDSRVQVKLMQIKLAPTSFPNPSPPTPPGASLRLFTPEEIPGQQKAMRFRWKISDSNGVSGYRLEILKQNRTPLLSRSGLIAPVFTWASPPSGKYFWRVAAVFDDQSRITSPTIPFTVAGSSIGVTALLIIAFVAVAALLAGYWWKRRNDRLSAASSAVSSEDQI